jgi:lipopolysaccharide export LptBFGC system permease protein LptF
MNEWINNAKDNFSISDIVAFLSMVGAIVAAFLAWKNKQKAGKCEAQAEQYCKEAKQYYEQAGEFFKTTNEELEHKKTEQLTKEKIIKYFRVKRQCCFSDIVTELFNSDEPLNLIQILNELKVEGYIRDERMLNGEWFFWSIN